MLRYHPVDQIEIHAVKQDDGLPTTFHSPRQTNESMLFLFQFLVAEGGVGAAPSANIRLSLRLASRSTAIIGIRFRPTAV